MTNKTATHAKKGNLHHETFHYPFAGQSITQVTSELENMGGCDENEYWDKSSTFQVNDEHSFAPLWSQYEPLKKAPKPNPKWDQTK
jgi:hypothetical protein